MRGRTVRVIHRVRAAPASPDPTCAALSCLDQVGYHPGDARSRSPGRSATSPGRSATDMALDQQPMLQLAMLTLDGALVLGTLPTTTTAFAWFCASRH